MKNYTLKLLFLVLTVTMYNCSSSDAEEIIDKIPDPIVTPTPTAKLTYDKNVKSIIDNSCATSGCHGTAKAGGISLTNYAEVKAAGESGRIFARIDNTGSPMPPAGLLATATRDIIKQWKTDGFLEK